MWNKWEESPVLASVETQLYPLNNIYFPAVAICNVNKVSKRKLLETMKKTKVSVVGYVALVEKFLPKLLIQNYC
jgi:hypothetical protein